MTTLIHDRILGKVQAALSPVYVDLQNESHMHAGPATESHFKLVVVSDGFAGLSKVKRHQKIYQLVKEELDGPVHALALHLYTEAEWKLTKVPESPKCSHSNA